MHKRILALLAAAAAGVASPAAFACSACGCTLNSDWASEGIASSGGWRLDLRYDFFEQDQLRSGTDSVRPGSIALPAEVEVQRYTINRNASFALDYTPNKDWGVNVTLPYFVRSHATVAEGDTEVSTSQDSGVGDLRVVGRWSGFAPQRSSGILFGLKLPTGHFSDDFQSGPRQGERVDRGLQLGTGTADAIVGFYNVGGLTQDLGYFAQAMLQQPLDSRAGFKPGTGLNVNLGLRYTASDTWQPQLQLNARAEKREQGVNADVENSGATLLYLSPGVTWQMNRHAAAFLFLQAPIYERVNGLQLEATRFVSVGVHAHF